MMAAFRILAIVMALVGSALFAPAQACDSPYPWLCKPVPSIDPPETAQPATKPQAAGKPLPITTQGGRSGKASARSTRTAQVQHVHKRTARKSVARHWALRARHAKI